MKDRITIDKGYLRDFVDKKDGNSYVLWQTIVCYISEFYVLYMWVPLEIENKFCTNVAFGIR